MPRPLRDKTAGIFHVYTHGVWGYPALFRDELDRLMFLRHLARVSTRGGLTCMAFCLMNNHYHLIVEVDDGILPAAMHDLNLPYALWFNSRARLRGHVQYDHYNSRRILDEDDLLGCNAYVANNPVRAELCRSADEWLWSSHAGTVGLREPHSFVDPSRLLAPFRWTPDPRAALREFVDLRRESDGLVNRR